MEQKGKAENKPANRLEEGLAVAGSLEEELAGSLEEAGKPEEEPAVRLEKAPVSRTEARMGNKADKTLLELSVGIIVWGILCQIIVVWFVSDKTGYSLGLWMGTLLAAAAGVHMWWALDRALDFAQDTAVKLMTKYNIIRYVVIVAVMALIMVSGFANPLAAFLGLMGLKVAAYLQPFTHKVLGYINN